MACASEKLVLAGGDAVVLNAPPIQIARQIVVTMENVLPSWDLASRVTKIVIARAISAWDSNVRARDS